MLRLILAGVLIALGLLAFIISTIGVFRLSNMLNRLHAAGLCETLAASLILLGLIILSGLTIFSLKLALVVIFLWLFNPVAIYLVARAEVMTHPKLEQVCDLADLDAATGELKVSSQDYANLQEQLLIEEFYNDEKEGEVA